MSSPISDLPPQHSTILLTPRLRLRPVRPSDIHPLHAIRRDPLAMKYMTGSAIDPEPIAEKSDSVRRIQLMMKPDRFSFAVELRDDPVSSPGETETGSTDSTNPSQGPNLHPQPPPLIGVLGIHRIPEVFYLFGSAHWGRGYATEALAAFVNCYWEKFPEGLPGMKEEGVEGFLEGHVFAENAGSARVLQKCGFVKVGEKVIENAGREQGAVMFRVGRPVGV